MATQNKNPYRLDRNIEPSLYTLDLTPDLERFTFQGKSWIAFHAQRPFSKIVLHALDLKITKAVLSLNQWDQTELKARKISFDAKQETVIFDFGKILKPSQANTLYLEFSGELNDKMHGFYRTSYQVNGEKKWGAATQFEATDARRAFPCLDEPDRKAKFRMTLRVPKHLTALSNMPALEEVLSPDSECKTITYQETPTMSTYLLAFVIAELESIEAVDKNGVLIRVWTTPGKKEQGRFALGVGLHALPYFAEWFDIPYVLPKMDMVSLPDFASGAMENWGLVTYRETALLVDPVNSSAQSRQRVAEVVDHELAHQWFGNLVTMEWWTDLWLNEGFASYMGPKAVDDQFPEWKVWDQFMVTDFMTALRDDSLKNTHPIEIPVQNPHEIREIFDHITYSKGATVNRMLEHFLGESIFRKGLRVYLKKYAYRNALTEDLWATLEKVSGKPVKSIMASYTHQGGYPVLTVRSKGKNSRELFLEQERFLFDGSPAPGKLWEIPLVMKQPESAKPFRALMGRRKMTVKLPSAIKSWIKINAGQSGFYRVAYPEELLNPLIAALSSGRLSSGSISDALGLLDDALALARSGYLKTSKALETLQSCKKQTDYNIWVTICGGLGQIDHLLQDAEAHERLAKFARNLLSSAANRLGWVRQDSNIHTDLLLRSLLLFSMGHYGDSATIREAQKRFAAFLGNGQLEPNLRGVVYSLAAENGDEKIFDQLVGIYLKTDLQEEKVRILRSLTRFRKKEIIQKILKFGFSAQVRRQDAYAVLGGFGGNPYGRELAWDFVKSNWKQLVERYSGSSVSLLTRVIEGSAGGFVSSEALKDVTAFFKKNPVLGTERTMKQTLEVIRCNAGWAKRSRREVPEWLAQFEKNAL